MLVFIGGSKTNVVPDFVDIKVSIRSYKSEVHELLIAAVKRLVRAECEASGSLAVREPEFKTMMHTPATINDIYNAAILKTLSTKTHLERVKISRY